jgi:hypothetical protein
MAFPQPNSQHSSYRTAQWSWWTADLVVMLLEGWGGASSSPTKHEKNGLALE